MKAGVMDHESAELILGRQIYFTIEKLTQCSPSINKYNRSHRPFLVNVENVL